MDDIGFKNGDIYIKNNDFTIMQNSEALLQQLYIFLNIRACHKNGNGEIVFPGECEWDQQQGIDFIYVFDPDTTNDQIKNHYKNKMLSYYGDYITKISEMTINRDQESRKITLEFEYKTIWSIIPQTFIL